jgi:hypothetical protein
MRTPHAPATARPRPVFPVVVLAVLKLASQEQRTENVR